MTGAVTNIKKVPSIYLHTLVVFPLAGLLLLQTSFVSYLFLSPIFGLISPRASICLNFAKLSACHSSKRLGKAYI